MPRRTSQSHAVKGKHGRKEKGTPPPLNHNVSISAVSEPTNPIFPVRTLKHLRYHTSFNLTTTSGAVNTHVLSANGIYDPDITGTGHQPMGFDQMMLFYEHYVGVSARLTVQAQNTASGSLHCGIRLEAAASPITVIDQILEFGKVTWEVLESKNAYGSCKTLTMPVDIASFQGIPRKNITTEEVLRGDISNMPAEQTYFHVLVWDPNSLTGTVTIDAVIEFEVWFIEPRTQILSHPSVATAIRKAVLSALAEKKTP